ncbi:hypothetical protein FIBSPDRAFT_234877 [Athelia psychrophila]|uniref:Uncharacterized protein n=1 Tax=Athelia psychrophila TaxID=1759441 RepID=A0A166RZ01_9AGAM|nr:hypothetical protein FIBSPDRAFT_234877 [Fibularhizoctonia sp. CBS 109695]
MNRQRKFLPSYSLICRIGISIPWTIQTFALIKISSYFHMPHRINGDLYRYWLTYKFSAHPSMYATRYLVI